MHALRLSLKRFQVLKKCLCGNRIHIIGKNNLFHRYDNLKFLALNAAYFTENITSQGTFQQNVNDSASERKHRIDLAGEGIKIVRNALKDLKKSLKNSVRIYKADLEKVLDGVKTEGLPIDTYGVLLLQCCGDLLPDELPATRIQLLHKIWNNLKDLGMKFTVQHYNALLGCYAENGHSVSPAKFLQSMGKVVPNEETFHKLLACTCEVGDIEMATETVSIMKNRGYPVSEPMFSALVLGHARAGDISSSVAMLELMHQAGISPSTATYTTLLQGFAEAGDIEKLKRTYREATMKSLTFSDKQIMKVVKSLAVSGHHNAVKTVLKWLPLRDANDSNGTEVILMAVHLLHLGYDDVVIELLDALPVPVSEPSPSFGVFLIHEMIKLDRPVTQIMLMVDQLVMDKRNLHAMEKAVFCALSLMKVDTALELFRAMKHRNLQIRPHYFWPLIIAANFTEGEKGVFDILRNMKEFEVDPDFDTLQDYILPRVAIPDPEILVRKLQDHGLGVGAVLSPLLSVLLKSGQFRAALKLCNRYKGHIESNRLVVPLMLGFMTTRDIENSVKMLKVMKDRSTVASDWAGQFLLFLIGFRKAAIEPEQISELLKAFQSKGLCISSFAAETLTMYLQYKLKTEYRQKLKDVVDKLVNVDLSIASTENLVVTMPHPNEMELDGLESHLIELRSKDMNRRGVLRKLLQEHCRQGNLEKALETKKEFESSGFEFSAGMLALLFDTMVRVGDLDEAKKLLSDLKRLFPNFVLDEFKVIDYATFLTTKDKYEDGMMLLEERAKAHSVKGGTPVSRNCCRFLTTVGEKKDGKETRDVLEKLVKLGYCTFSNALLGPVVRAYLNRNDLKGAVEEYKRCAVQHKATPLQYEMMCALVKMGEKEIPLLQQVLDASTKVHGRASTDAHLAVALAETGLTKQLRRFLMEKELNAHVLQTWCKRLVTEDKLDTLMNLMQAGRGITSLNLTTVYMHMLQIYSRRGDCDGALALWSSMEEEGELQPPEFLTMLAALLRSHKRNVPFTVPVGSSVKPAGVEPPHTVLFSR